jgi:hypothetical protein
MSTLPQKAEKAVTGLWCLLKARFQGNEEATEGDHISERRPIGKMELTLIKNKGTMGMGRHRCEWS